MSFLQLEKILKIAGRHEPPDVDKELTQPLERVMEYRSLGRSGIKISALSYGAWITFGKQIDDEQARLCLKTAFDAGINFFDNAEVYADGQAERVMGAAIRQLGLSRDSFLISTKLFWGGEGPNQRGLSRKHIIEGLSASLQRLQLDYVDLLFCHRPDYQTPIEETVRAMNHVIDKGHALYWGTSEWPAEQIIEAHAVARREHLIPPLMEQPQYHLFHRQRVEVEYARLYDEFGLGLTTWSPLAGGLLTGKYQDGQPPKDTRATVNGMEWLVDRFVGEEAQQRIAVVNKLRPVAHELGCSLAQLAIAWCLCNQRVSTVITGASRPAQVRENMQALTVAKQLIPTLLKQIDTTLGSKPEPPKEFR